MHQLLDKPFGLDTVHLRPFGASLTEEDHEFRKDNQAERITKRIDEIMAMPDPLTGLFELKASHKGLGHDELIDEAILECKKVFNFSDVKVKSASMLAMQKEAERKQRIREMARKAATRAGILVEDDPTGESLIPKPRVTDVKRSAKPATIEDLTADQMDMLGDISGLSEESQSAVRQNAVKTAQARFDGKFGEQGRFLITKENTDAGTGNRGGDES